MVLTLGLASWMIGALIVVFLLVSILMVLVVLVQKPQGVGLSGAFGGNAAASGQTAFGAKTGDALTVMTIGIFVAYLLGAIVLNWAARPSTTPPPSPVVVPTGDAPVEPAPAPASTPGTMPGTTPGSAETTPPAVTPSTPPVVDPVQPQATPETGTPAASPATPPADPSTAPPTAPPTTPPSEPRR